MKYIDKTYFQGIIAIPNKDEEFVQLGQLIKDSSNLIIKDVLGYDLLKQLLDANLNDTTSKFYKLMYGTEYTVNGVVCKWKGFINDEKQSLLAYYTFYKWADSEWLLNFGGGSGTIIPDNAIIENQTMRIVRVEQLIEKEIRELYDWIYYEKPFGEFDFIYKFKNPVTWLF